MTAPPELNAVRSAGPGGRCIAMPCGSLSDVATALGCRIGALAKTLVLDAARLPELIVTSLNTRVDPQSLRSVIGNPSVKLADPKFVLENTGQKVGAVGPFGHPAPVKTLIDQRLAQFATIWVGTGHPGFVLPTSFSELVTRLDVQPVDIH